MPDLKTPAQPLLLVTRPQPQAAQWVAQLQALGQAAAALPLLGLDSPAKPEVVRAAFASLPACALAMFVSPSAVARWRQLAPAGWAWPAGVLAGSTGPGTQAALLQAGVPAAQIVSPPHERGEFDSEALWQQLRPLRDWSGCQVQIVRGEGGRPWLADTLRAAGAQVHFVEAYKRTAPVLDGAGQALLAAALAQPGRHCWLFSSSEAVAQLATLVATKATTSPRASTDWSTHQALATHERIAQAAQALGMTQVRLVRPEPQAVLHALQAGSAQPPALPADGASGVAGG